MEAVQKPDMKLLHTGGTLKTLQVIAKAGMIMPPHHTTKEAVLVVQEGMALLNMPTTEHLLKAGMTFTISAKVEHSLKIKKDFKAVVIMALDAAIQF
ncbi:cupin domain-containing protein [Marixanthomonas spongiae]|uniref:Cupin n=1 Tax=Marixanthomonas spongiae TaxID=2174845 RepID=A0A2U0I471_9FLAO|nr:cupin [Marixanthomonas spongiae]PVW15912.1 cupin [Marixanthomonas spongiae]